MSMRVFGRFTSLLTVVAILFSLMTFSVYAENGQAAASTSLRPMEYLTRGLVAAQVPGGIFLSWRFLGNEPDGLSWNIYRKDGDADFVKTATITPGDVQPESNYDTNPGIVKENVTPSNYTDPNGLVTSIYEVAPVINGVEGFRQGMSVPMLSAFTGTNATKGAISYIQMKPAPAAVPLAHFTYRGTRFGPGTNLSQPAMVLPGTNGQNWYVIDMDLLKGFRMAHDDQTTVTQEQLDGWVATLNQYNTTPNLNGVATYAAARPLTNSLVGGKITDALYKELEGEFIKYVENLDCGPKLPYATTNGAIYTSMSSAYSTHDMTVGDFDGDGEYEIVVKWRSTQQDPMMSEPIYGGSGTTTAPEYIDVYKLDGTLLFRVDMGYNVRAGNDHETTLFCQDFDNDGKAELMLKTALGTRIGNWDEASQSVIYPETLDTVVGGVDGLNATTTKFKEYFTTGNTVALDTYWSLLNSFDICYRTPTATGGNDGVNDPTIKRWIKTYHVGPIGPAKDGQEFFSAFAWNTDTGKGVLVDSAKYPFTYAGSVDGENWAMTPCSQRGNYSYLAYPGPGAGTMPSNYKAQIMAQSEAYWLVHPWKAAVWGDAQGNRGNRYLGVVAALDGVNYYAVSQRGYYARTTFAAYNIVNGKVNLQACFDSADPQYWSLGGTAYDYQNRGNHQTQTGDLDGDGRDEIVMKAMVLDLNADKTKILPKVLNGDIMPTIEGMDSTTPAAGVFQFGTDAVRNNPLNVWAPLRHGDRSALLPVDKNNNIRMWSGNEESLMDDLRNGQQYGWMPGPEAHDPMKGKQLNDQGQVVYNNSLVFGSYSAGDDEGSVAGNFSNRWPGAQSGSTSAAKEVRSLVTGEVLTTTNTARGIAQGQNAIWFGGSLTAMTVSSATINSINDLTFATSTYLNTGLTSTGNKSTPTLKADMFGDWREELILRASNNRLAIVTTLSPTQYGIRTLMHDPMYRNGVANKNTGYDQCGFASFYLGDEAKLPSMRTDIAVPNANVVNTTVSGNGTISPAGPLLVNKGESKTFTVIPDAGYKLSSLKVDGIEADTNLTSYTFGNITNDHTLDAVFVKDPTGNVAGTVTNGSAPLVGATVSITTAGAVYTAKTDAEGKYAIANVKAGTGYSAKAFLTGFSIGYADTSVLDSTTTAGVNFVLNAIPANKYNVLVSASPANGGTVAGDGTYNEGDSVTATASPLSGFKFANWTLYNPAKTTDAGLVVSTNASYSFILGTTDASLVAVFNPDVLTVNFDKNGGDSEAKPTSKTVILRGNIGTLPAAPTKAGYSFAGWNTAANGNGKVFTTRTAVTSNMTVYAQWVSNSSGSGNTDSGSSGSVTAPVVSPITAMEGKITASATMDNSGKATASLTEAQVNAAINNVNKVTARVEINLVVPAGAKSVETTIPAKSLDTAVNGGIKAFTISSSVATITFDSKALGTISSGISGNVAITAAKVDASALSAEARKTVGDRPVYNFSVSGGGKTVSQFNGNVTVSVPYTPKAGEDPNAIIIYYINADGRMETVNNCAYDPKTGNVTFKTNHFSQYAVGYNKVNFNDVAANAWYSKVVSFVAARGITTGTGNGQFSPMAKLTRGEFLVMAMKAYGMSPDANPSDNFSDAGNTWYTGYLAAAKRLGITSGTGNNKYEPQKEITRQELFTLLYNILKQKGTLPTSVIEKTTASFSDADKISPWAKDAMSFFVKAGTISGSNGKLTPGDVADRAQMAQILYNLLSK